MNCKFDLKKLWMYNWMSKLFFLQHRFSLSLSFDQFNIININELYDRTLQRPPSSSLELLRFSAVPVLVVVSPRSVLNSWTIPTVPSSVTSRVPFVKTISSVFWNLNVKLVVSVKKKLAQQIKEFCNKSFCGQIFDIKIC